MRKVILAFLAAGAIAALSTSSAEAWGGCGPYRHPTPWGCRWNGGYWGGPVYHYGWGWRHPYWHRHYWHHWRRW
jgi:hypothetical protein